MCSRVPRLGWKRCWKRGSSRPWLRLETRSTGARPCLACLAQVRKTHEVLRDEHFQRKLRSINSWKARSDPKPMKVSVLKTRHILAWLPTKLCINCAASHYSATASFHFLIFSPHFSMSSGSCCETSKSERVPIKGSQLRSANCSNLAMENHEEMQQKHSETWNRRWLWGIQIVCIPFMTWKVRWSIWEDIKPWHGQFGTGWVGMGPQSFVAGLMIRI